MNHRIWKQLMGICTKFLDIWDAKIKKNIRQRKIITHKTIFTWFDNLSIYTELQGFYYSQRKIQSAAVQFFFFLSLKNDIKTLVSKTTVLYPTHKIHNGLQKWPKNFLECNSPSRSAHGQASKNLPLKTATILFWVGS